MIGVADMTLFIVIMTHRNNKRKIKYNNNNNFFSCFSRAELELGTVTHSIGVCRVSVVLQTSQRSVFLQSLIHHAGDVTRRQETLLLIQR